MAIIHEKTISLPNRKNFPPSEKLPRFHLPSFCATWQKTGTGFVENGKYYPEWIEKLTVFCQKERKINPKNRNSVGLQGGVLTVRYSHIEGKPS